MKEMRKVAIFYKSPATVVSAIFARRKFHKSLDLRRTVRYFIFANGKFILSLALPGYFCITIGDGTVWCYCSRDKVLVFLIFYIGRSLASWNCSRVSR